MTPWVAAPTLRAVTTVHRLSRTDARRIAVQAQLLDAERPVGLLDLVRHLSFLQLDPIAAVAPSAHLVAWSRMGSSYSQSQLREALDRRSLVELQALIRPAEDLARLRSPGPLTMRELPVIYAKPWESASKAAAAAVRRELKDLARWLELDLMFAA
jgi:uncharacterized protein YcaQ